MAALVILILQGLEKIMEYNTHGTTLSEAGG